MAIYHFSEKNISRGDGRSAVACAAYRSGEKLIDHTYGKTQDYTKKEGVEYSRIYAPSHTDPKLLNRETLWNEVEKAERNKNGNLKLNARLAKEYEVALPHELTSEQRKALVDDFCQKFVDEYKLIADASIHAAHDDNKNFHAHILFTTRKVNTDGVLGAKERDFNDKGPEILRTWRATFAGVTNSHLERAGLDVRVDHRSYKDQGRDYLQATIHEGNEITFLRRDGIDTDISLKNDAIIQKNEELKELEQVIKGLDQEILLTRSTDYSSLIKGLEKELDQVEAEEKELLAELQKLDELEQEQRESQQAAEIEKTYADFTTSQATYADFADRFYELGDSVNRHFDDMDKALKKSEKWLSKQTAFYLGGNDCFYDSYHHSMISMIPPPFFVTEKKVEEKKKKVMERYKLDAAKLAEQVEIEKVVATMRISAEKLTDQGIDLPIPEPTFFQKLTGAHIHSFKTLSNFESDMKPVLAEHRKDIEQARFQTYQKYKEQEEYDRKEQVDQANRRAEHDLEVENRRRARLQQERYWTDEPTPTKTNSKNTDNNNNFGI